MEERAIGARVRDMRRRIRLNQARLGALIGLSRDQVNNIEIGRVALRFEPGWALCSEFDLNPLWLWSGEGDRLGFLDMSGAGDIPWEVLFSDIASRLGDDYAKDRAERLRRNADKTVRPAEALFGRWIREVSPVQLADFFRAMDRAARTFVFESRTKVNVQLTSRTDGERVAPMLQRQAPLWPELRERIRRLTRVRGNKAQLARDIGVTRQAINAMLSKTRSQPYVPSAEYALRLNEWVIAQQKSRGDRVVARSPHKPKKGKSANDKPNSGRKK